MIFKQKILGLVNLIQLLIHIVSFIMLRYAQKHNYPAQRSALTWWEDKIPSRIDLGKCKYGGPFTVDEEVETRYKDIFLSY